MHTPVSYTHLDVYKRQIQDLTAGYERCTAHMNRIPYGSLYKAIRQRSVVRFDVMDVILLGLHG